MKSFFFYSFPFGVIGIGEIDGKISDIVFSDVDVEKDYEVKETDLIIEAKTQLLEYFLGKRQVFDLPLVFYKGTKFQKKVWKALLEIPYGETKSYKEIAEIAGSPKGARAVGGANNKNPISIVVPCHRVIGADGSLVGYGGGLEKKVFLLELENNWKPGEISERKNKGRLVETKR